MMNRFSSSGGLSDSCTSKGGQCPLELFRHTSEDARDLPLRKVNPKHTSDNQRECDKEKSAYCLKLFTTGRGQGQDDSDPGGNLPLVKQGLYDHQSRLAIRVGTRRDEFRLTLDWCQPIFSTEHCTDARNV